jgi:hypothetical protein
LNFHARFGKLPAVPNESTLGPCAVPAPTPHDLVSLVAAATLFYYQTASRPGLVKDTATRMEIHRLSMALATVLPLFRTTTSGDVHPLTDGERETLMLLNEHRGILDDPSRWGASVAVRAVDLGMVIDSARRSPSSEPG